MTKKEITKILKTGGVGVLPTDTLYGLVGSALDRSAIKKVSRLKQRQKNMPFIVLISTIADLKKFGLKLDQKAIAFLKTIWPGPISVAFPTSLKLRGASSIGAFRWPKNKFLNELIKQTGPLIAPSANPPGHPVAETVTEAKQYFGNQVDFYLSASKKLTGKPSTLISIKKDKIEVLREGRIKIKQTKI